MSTIRFHRIQIVALQSIVDAILHFILHLSVAVPGSSLFFRDSCFFVFCRQLKHTFVRFCSHSFNIRNWRKRIENIKKNIFASIKDIPISENFRFRRRAHKNYFHFGVPIFSPILYSVCNRLSQPINLTSKYFVTFIESEKRLAKIKRASDEWLLKRDHSFQFWTLNSLFHLKLCTHFRMYTT